jgi:hypothetical protein
MNCGIRHLTSDDVYFLFLWQQKAEKKITEKEFWKRVNGLESKKTYTKLYFGKI